MACTDQQTITQTHIIKIKPPVITACQRLAINDCQPKTNGQLYQCALQISKNLALCADQTDTLIEWQQNNEHN